jgi:glycosyltransferase involved in cell wall biosynthesis
MQTPESILHRADASSARPVIALTANTAWNLAHFRAPLLRAFAARGAVLVALAPADAAVKKLQDMGCTVEPLPLPAHGRNPWSDVVLFWKYLRLLRRYRPTVLLSFTVKPNIYGGLAARCLGIAQIGNISGLGTAFIQGGWLGRLVEMLYRLGLGGAKTIFFQNPDDRDFFLLRCLVRPSQADLLPGSGVDLRHFAPMTKPSTIDHDSIAARQPFVFLFIGRLLGDKGLLELVQAFKLLQQQIGQEMRPPLPSACLKIVGPAGGTNPTAIASSLQSQWQQDPQLELLGHVEDLRPCIAMADCVVLPSYREGTPRSLLEAAAMGRPLIATDVPGCREVVHDGVNGYRCRVKDVPDLTRAMLAMMKLSDAQRQAMGLASRKLAEEVFDENRVVEKYFKAMDLESFRR